MKIIKYTFCINRIISLRKNNIKKICYKKKYYFLNLKHTPTYTITNRLLKRGNVLKIYKKIKYFYYEHLLQNNFKSIPQTSAFLFFYKKYYSFRDFDKVLLWKFKQLNCMFIFKAKYLRKKKKYLTKTIFLFKKKRTLYCINILKNLILLYCRRKKKNITNQLFYPLHNYLTQDKFSLIHKVKYRIYKQKLAKMQL